MVNVFESVIDEVAKNSVVFLGRQHRATYNSHSVEDSWLLVKSLCSHLVRLLAVMLVPLKISFAEQIYNVK